jgi:hypothetical protein
LSFARKKIRIRKNKRGNVKDKGSQREDENKSKMVKYAQKWGTESKDCVRGESISIKQQGRNIFAEDGGSFGPRFTADPGDSLVHLLQLTGHVAGGLQKQLLLLALERHVPAGIFLSLPARICLQLSVQAAAI